MSGPTRENPAFLPPGPPRRPEIPDRPPTSRRPARALPRLLASGRDVLREHGLLRLVGRILPWFACRRYLFLARPLAAAPPPSRPGPPVRLTALAKDEAALLVGLRPAFYEEGEVRERLRRGHRCYLGWLGDRPVNIRWVFLGSTEVPYLRHTLRLAPDQVFTDEVYTVPGARRNGFNERAGEHLYALLASSGYRLCLFATASWDSVVLRSARRRGFLPVGEATVRRGPRQTWLRLTGRLEAGEGGSLVLNG